MLSTMLGPRRTMGCMPPGISGAKLLTLVEARGGMGTYSSMCAVLSVRPSMMPLPRHLLLPLIHPSPCSPGRATLGDYSIPPSPAPSYSTFPLSLVFVLRSD